MVLSFKQHQQHSVSEDFSAQADLGNAGRYAQAEVTNVCLLTYLFLCSHLPLNSCACNTIGLQICQIGRWRCLSSEEHLPNKNEPRLQIPAPSDKAGLLQTPTTVAPGNALLPAGLHTGTDMHLPHAYPVTHTHANKIYELGRMLGEYGKGWRGSEG